MLFKLAFTHQANADYEALEKNKTLLPYLKKTQKTLGYLEINTFHPRLSTHQYNTLTTPHKQEIFKSHIQNASTYQIFWCYGPRNNEITILTITPFTKQ